MTHFLYFNLLLLNIYKLYRIKGNSAYYLYILNNCGARALNLLLLCGCLLLTFEFIYITHGLRPRNKFVTEIHNQV